MCNSKMCNWLKGLFGMKSCCEKKGCCEEKGCCEDKKAEETVNSTPTPEVKNEEPVIENQEEQKS